MSETVRLVTAEELEKFPDDGYRFELVEGRVVRMGPVGFSHGRIVTQVAFLLQAHIKGRNLGVVSVELGCKLQSNPDTVRGPRFWAVGPYGFHDAARLPEQTGARENERTGETSLGNNLSNIVRAGAAHQRRRESRRVLRCYARGCRAM
jgi:hypothetical protein